jgi:hypothetical protein
MRNSLLLAPMTVVTEFPASRIALDCSSNGAIMTLPPTQRTLPNFLISDGLPSGPVMLSMLAPSARVASPLVVLPTSWKANDTVPFCLLMSLMVNGMRSPLTP